MNLDATIPPEWLTILAEVKKDCNEESMFLVGGAVRDLVLGTPIKDLDIFCTRAIIVPDYFNSSTPVSTKSPELLEALCVSYNEDDAPPNRINKAYTTMMCGWEVNLIVSTKRPTFDSIIEDFDFGICQIGLDVYELGYGIYQDSNRGMQIKYTQAFLDDVENKTLTITNKKFSRESHTDKMLAKFPDYKLVDPEAEDVATDKFFATYNCLGDYGEPF